MYNSKSIERTLNLGLFCLDCICLDMIKAWLTQIYMNQGGVNIIQLTKTLFS